MNDLVLALDTTHELGSIALLRGETLLEQVTLQSPNGFGPILFGRIGDLLERHGANIQDIALFAAAAGPGAFTGVRIGLAAIKGFAATLGKPAIGVNNLQALASFGTSSRRAAVLDARRGDIYGGLYDEHLQPLAPAVVMPLPAWAAQIGDVEFVAMEPEPFAAQLPAARFTRSGPALAAAVGQLAWDRFTNGAPCDPAAIEAEYIRQSDAELSWTDLAAQYPR